MNLDSIGIIIQARMGSSRLLGKVMKKIDDSNTIIENVVKQLKFSKCIKKIVIATTNLEEDNIIVDLCKKIDIVCFRGDPNDVLDRYYNCAKKFDLKTIIRITCDNPLIDPKIMDKMVESFCKEPCDLLSNCLPRTFPQGTEVEIISFSALEAAYKNAKKPSEREHVTPFIINNPERFRIRNFSNSKDISKLRWTVDREDDLNFVKELVSRIKKSPIHMEDIINVIDSEPELLNINKDYILNEGYLKSLQNDG